MGPRRGWEAQAGTHHQSSRTCPAMQTSRGCAFICVCTHTHTHTLCTQTSTNSKSIHNWKCTHATDEHNRKCTHMQQMHLQTHNNTHTRAFINTQVTYNRHMKQTCAPTAAHGHLLGTHTQQQPKGRAPEPASWNPGKSLLEAPSTVQARQVHLSQGQGGQVTRFPQQLGGQALQKQSYREGG